MNISFTDQVVADVKKEAINLEGMYTSREEYIAAMNDLIAYFTQSRDAAIENEEIEF